MNSGQFPRNGANPGKHIPRQPPNGRSAQSSPQTPANAGRAVPQRAVPPRATTPRTGPTPPTSRYNPATQNFRRNPTTATAPATTSAGMPPHNNASPINVPDSDGDHRGLLIGLAVSVTVLVICVITAGLMLIPGKSNHTTSSTSATENSTTSSIQLSTSSTSSTSLSSTSPASTLSSPSSSNQTSAPAPQAPFSFNSFDPCAFTDTQLDVFQVAFVHKYQHSPEAATSTSPEALISACTYTDEKNEWIFTTSKQEYHGVPDTFTRYAQLPLRQANDEIFLTNTKILINDHLAYQQEVLVKKSIKISQDQILKAGSTICSLRVSPGVTYFLANNKDADNAAFSSALCLLLSKFTKNIY